MEHDIHLFHGVNNRCIHLMESHQLYNHNTSPNIDNEIHSIILKFD
jgi:hypothetical protein